MRYVSPRRIPVRRVVSVDGPEASFSLTAGNRRRAFTILELIVVMAIIALLAALSLPAIGRARLAGKRTECMNNLRNIALALTQFEATQGRLPASGYIYDDGMGFTATYHSWAVSILAYVDQQPLANQWDLDKPITFPTNEKLTQSRIPVYICPIDISRSPPKKGGGDLSYVVNGGMGFTVRYTNGVGDCPVDRNWTLLDLNGNGVGCPPEPADDGSPNDRTMFKQVGLFFLENWKGEQTQGTVRHHALADVKDGLSQTFMVTENVRAGYDPDNPDESFASPNPYRCAFYIGNPCRNGNCSAGNVDYSLCNSGSARINSGLKSSEGSSPIPNSFHDGGVNMAFADGHLAFLSERINGAVYAALSSPQGLLLNKTPLEQLVLSDGY